MNNAVVSTKIFLAQREELRVLLDLVDSILFVYIIRKSILNSISKRWNNTIPRELNYSLKWATYFLGYFCLLKNIHINCISVYFEQFSCYGFGLMRIKATETLPINSLISLCFAIFDSKKKNRKIQNDYPVENRKLF